MNTLERTVHGKRELLMTHMIAGYPDMETSAEIARSMISAGADILEIQIPFSDPMADGPTIAAACSVAVGNAPSPTHAFELARLISREHPQVPIVIMCYGNSMYRYGIERFVKDAAARGVAGIIVPDIPLDSPEGMAFVTATKKYDVSCIPVISPGVSVRRLRVILPLGSGFIYCTSRQGTTGKAASLTAVQTYIKTIKKVSSLPVGIGFGIRTREDVAAVHAIAPVAIAGSVFIPMGPEEIRARVHDMKQR